MTTKCQCRDKFDYWNCRAECYCDKMIDCWHCRRKRWEKQAQHEMARKRAEALYELRTTRDYGSYCHTCQDRTAHSKCNHPTE